MYSNKKENMVLMGKDYNDGLIVIYFGWTSSTRMCLMLKQEMVLKRLSDNVLRYFKELNAHYVTFT